LINLDPFDNKVVTFKITGRQLKDVLRRSRPAVSGIRYRWENGELTEVSIGGQPVEDSRVYSGASNSYFAGASMKGIEVNNTGKVRFDVLLDQIRKKGTVTPLYDGRRVIIGRSPTAP
jgi:2',3'-cyclic-nucleotide 2'-phosphodiesterase (5'-nucleotidase family)